MKINIFIIAAFAVAGFGHIFSASHPPLKQQDTEGDVHGSEGDVGLGVDLPGVTSECHVIITYLVRVPISDSESIQAAAAGVRERKELTLVVKDKEAFLEKMEHFFRYYGSRVEFKVSNAAFAFDGRKTPERPGTPKGKDFASFSENLLAGLPPFIKITVVFSSQASVEKAYDEGVVLFAAS